MSLLAVPEMHVLRVLSPDGRLLFATRVVRLFAYGFLAVVLALYLAALGLSEQQIGLVLSLTLAGDAVISLYITSIADRIGRRRMLFVSSGLIVLAGVVFTLAVACAPFVSGALLGAAWLVAPFLIAGGLKIAYDLLLYRSFRALKPPEER